MPSRGLAAGGSLRLRTGDIGSRIAGTKAKFAIHNNNVI